MTSTDPEQEQDPCYHAGRIRKMLRDVAEQAREDVNKVADPKAQALFETTTEVLNGLIVAYEHYERQIELAWQ